MPNWLLLVKLYPNYTQKHVITYNYYVCYLDIIWLLGTFVNRIE